MSFSQAVSGLKAASTQLDVIGNNIANSSTYGFKSSRISFADMFAGSSIGMGVKVASVLQNFNDGTTTFTGRNLDLALGGNGFFRMQDASGGVFYSRNGQLQFDNNRNIVNAQGMFLTGYPATGNPPKIQQGAEPQPLNIPEGMIGAQETTSGKMQVNLRSGHAPVTVTLFDANNPDSFNFVSTMTTYDSLGNAHNISVYFSKTANNTWDVNAVDNSLQVVPPATPFVQSLGTMTFDGAGILIQPAVQAEVILEELNGSNPGKFTLDFVGSMQHNVAEDSVTRLTQNGFAPGEFIGFQIGTDGSLTGLYSNQERRLLGQIMLANFSNAEGLIPEGNNVWSESGASGQPILGIAGSSSFGRIEGGSLEASNVDMGQELVDMIVAQRYYQSNSQTIKTQDQVLQTLINIR